MSEFKPVAKKTIGYVPIQKVLFLLCLDDFTEERKFNFKSGF